MKRPKTGLALIPELIRTLFKKPTTVDFPFGDLALPEHIRGRIEIDPEACVGCGACTRDCPADALVMERDGDRFRLVSHMDRCAYCGQCELSCPTDALRMTHQIDSAGGDRRNLVEVKVDKERRRKKKRDAEAMG